MSATTQPAAVRLAELQARLLQTVGHKRRARMKAEIEHLLEQVRREREAREASRR